MRKVLYILGELHDEDLGWLLEAGTSRRVEGGTSIIRQGESLDTLFIVLEGEFAVTIEARNAREIARLGSGEVLGDMSLLDSRPPNATVTATTDSDVYAISQNALRAKLARDEAFASRFYRALCIFLANRLSRTVAMVGDGGAPSLSEDVREEDEISPEVLEKVTLAGARFDMFLQRMKGS